MEKTQFLTLFMTFEKLEVVKETLPSVIAETKKNDARLIVHDSSEDGKDEKWSYLRDLNKDRDFFLILSDNLSMAHARNMCLFLGQSLYAPDYICMVEDDHLFSSGLIRSMVDAMKKYYGQVSPSGLRYGLFSGCATHCYAKRSLLEDGHACLDKDSEPGMLGGANSCCRCAPTAHWNNVLKGYDTDEYLISTYQTKHLNYRNYHKGFTTLIVDNGARMSLVENEGRGTSQRNLKLWDEIYTASDYRSSYRRGSDKD